MTMIMFGEKRVSHIVLAYIIVIRVVEFSSGGTKYERFLPKNQHTQRKLLNFDNWVNREYQFRCTFIDNINF